MPFLAEKKIIVLKNLMTTEKHEGLVKEINKRIKENNLVQTNDYIFFEEVDSFKNKNSKDLFEILKKEKFSQEFKKLKGAELNNWIKNKIKEKDLNLDFDALNFLILNIADDLYKLENILDQLFFYKQKEKIKISDIKLFLEEKIDDNIFNLIDNIFSHNKNKVYKMIQEQYKQGKNSSYILAMIIRQIRIFIEIRDLYEKENDISSDFIAKKTKLHPFVVKKSLALVKKYELNYLKNIYKKLLEIDIKTKTTNSDPEILIDFLINKI
jgi:DNA polymerase-3 subunit delta